MILKRTNSDDPDFRRLVAQLDEYLAVVDGDEHAYYAQFNGIDKIANVVVAYDGDQPVGCGAFKPYSGPHGRGDKANVRCPRPPR